MHVASAARVSAKVPETNPVLDICAFLQFQSLWHFLSGGIRED